MEAQLSWVDLALAAVLGVSVIVGLWRGLVFEVMSLAGWVVAYFAAGPLAPLVIDWLPAARLSPAALHLLAVVLAFAGVLLVWGLASRLLKALIHASPLSPLDRLGGAGFGALRGGLIACLLVLVVAATPFADTPTWQASRAAPFLTGLLRDLAPLLPEPVSRFVSRSTPPAVVSAD